MRNARPRLKWHKLRRRRTDPAFSRANLEAGLAARAPIEVDLVATADGHFVCLHDLTLDRETTGTGPVAAATRAAVERLRQRANDGTPLATAPLFLHELVDAARRHASPPTGLIQLDLKEPAADITPARLDRLAATLGELAPAFIAGGAEWAAVERLAAAAPGIHKGFDPLDFHESSPPRDRAGFEALAALTVRTAPRVSIYYLEADLVLAGLDHGVDMVGLVTGEGAEVDAWTVDPDRPEIGRVLRRLVQAGCHQITTNDPEALDALLTELPA
jgi:glycerophosphoryl diester phosphodiesterase